MRLWDGAGKERFAVPGGIGGTSALAISPDLLVLDDPTLGLDVVARKSLFEEVIAELADRGITVFLTTHDLAGIETLADRVALIKNGVLVVEEELDALKARFSGCMFATSSPFFVTSTSARIA